ncbi:MAG: hypothetical protein E7069_05815 [Bacteroidales bacterium]|jgi:hypothetical protein|nr:hypothetical protein [Bacteroidales bacterium]
MNNADEIIERFSRQQPTLSNPDELTDSIMRNLPQREMRPVRLSPMLLALRLVSSAAAMWLIGLYIFINMQSESQLQEVTYVRNSTESADLQLCGTIKMMFVNFQTIGTQNKDGQRSSITLIKFANRTENQLIPSYTQLKMLRHENEH